MFFDILLVNLESVFFKYGLFCEFLYFRGNGIQELVRFVCVIGRFLGFFFVIDLWQVILVVFEIGYCDGMNDRNKGFNDIIGMV